MAPFGFILNGVEDEKSLLTLMELDGKQMSMVIDLLCGSITDGFGDEFDLEHYIFKEKSVRSCLKTKELVSDSHKKEKLAVQSVYSYECKECTKNRIRNN